MKVDYSFGRDIGGVMGSQNTQLENKSQLRQAKCAFFLSVIPAITFTMDDDRLFQHRCRAEKKNPNSQQYAIPNKLNSIRFLNSDSFI